MNEKVKNTNQGVNFDPLSARELSYHDDSPPPQKVRSSRDVYDSCTFALMTTEPLSYKKAQDKEEWINTIKEEIDGIERNEKWELVDLSRSFDAIGVKLINRLKYNLDGSVKKHKARLVTKKKMLNTMVSIILKCFHH